MDNLKLTIELVPSTSWFNNLRNQMSRKDWDTLRMTTYSKYNHCCGICNDHPKMLHCHELWDYNDKLHIQTLKGFIALCVMCHHVKHIGYAGILADKGELNFDDVVKHFMKINNCGRDTFYQYHDEIFNLWNERSKYNWKIDLGIYADLVQQPKA